MTVTIIRVIRGVQPYPRNGNVNNQKPVYDWIVRVRGRDSHHLETLKAAKLLAAEYGVNHVTVVRDSGQRCERIGKLRANQHF